jgi:hypothetical protein
MPDNPQRFIEKINRIGLRVRPLVVHLASQLNYLQAASAQPRNRSIPMTFVTASDTSHAKSLINLIRSLRRMTPSAQVVVFDLGMTPREVRNLKRTFPSVRVEKFPYKDFPAYFAVRVEAGQYAWKAQCVERVAAVSTGDLFWIDAGCVVTGTLRRIRKILGRRGIFADKAVGPSSRWTHPATFAALNAGTQDIELRRDQLAATFIGFRLGREDVECLISDWARHSRDRNVIAPRGSSRINHRQDQSVFSILMYRFLAASTPKRLLSFAGYWPKGVKDYLVHQDVD